MTSKTNVWKVSFDGENTGSAWIVGNDISTDDIIAGKYLEIRDMVTLSTHVFERFNNNFAKKVNPGDVIVAGNNFGCGSSREQAPFLLQYLGIGAIFAQSFARIFYRNAINIGLPAVNIDQGIRDAFKQGDTVRYSFNPFSITNLASSDSISLKPMPSIFMKMLIAGGAIPLLKKELEKE